MALGNITTEQTTISLPGQKKEQGKFFIASEQALIAPLNFICYGIETGSRKVNFGFQGIFGQESLAQFFKESILADIGTPLNIHNADHNSFNTTEVIIGNDPNVSDTGILWSQYYTTPTIPYNSGEEWGSRMESYILRPNAQYLLCFNNLIVATSQFGLKFGWFEFD